MQVGLASLAGAKNPMPIVSDVFPFMADNFAKHSVSELETAVFADVLRTGIRPCVCTGNSAAR